MRRPLTRPRALMRVWCLSEVMCVKVANVAAEVALGPAVQAGVASKLVLAFSDTRSAEATASSPADEAMVKGWIEAELGLGR